MTSSRSDLRSTGCFAGLLSILASVELLLAFQFFVHFGQRIEAGVPELAEPFHPGGLHFEPAWPDPAGARAPDLLDGDESRLLEHADVFLHAREGHLELVGE